MRLLAHPAKPAAIDPVPRSPRIRSQRRAAAPSRTRDRASAGQRPVARRGAPPGAAAVRRRRADQGRVPRRARDRRLGRARARHAARAPAPGARLALHHGGGADPRPRHRRQHRDLQPRQRGAVPRAGVRRSRSPRQHLSERPRRAGRSSSTRTPPTWTWRSTPTSLRRRWPASIPNPGALSPRRRRPRCGRRVHDGDVSRRPGTPAVARPLVRRRRRSGPGRRSSPSLGHQAWTRAVPRRSVRRRTHDPD